MLLHGRWKIAYTVKLKITGRLFHILLLRKGAGGFHMIDCFFFTVATHLCIISAAMIFFFYFLNIFVSLTIQHFVFQNMQYSVIYFLFGFSIALLFYRIVLFLQYYHMKTSDEYDCQWYKSPQRPNGIEIYN